MKLSNWSIFYLILAIIGLIATWTFNILYINNGGTFASTDVLVNNLTISFTIDIYFVAFVFSIWVFRECKRLNIRWPLLYVVLTFVLALAFSFPLFLAVRVHAMEKEISRENIIS